MKPTVTVAVMIAGLLLAGRPAWALDTCAGTYSASLMSPVSGRTVQLQDSTQASNLADITARFKAGLAQSGIIVGSKGASQMNFAASVTPPGASSGAPPKPGTYHGLGWAVQGGPGAPPITGGTLQASVTLTDIRTSSLNWLANISCTVRTEDRGLLAQQIGALIGSAVGQNFDQRRM